MAYREGFALMPDFFLKKSFYATGVVNFDYHCKNFSNPMNNANNKKRVVVKYQNMPEELQDAVKKAYPHGFTDHMIRIEKGPGDFFYAVVFETEDTNYLVKIDVNIDGKIEEEEDKEYYNDEIKGAEEIIDSADEEEED